MLNRSARLVMSTSVLKALPGKLDIKRQSIYGVRSTIFNLLRTHALISANEVLYYGLFALYKSIHYCI